MSAPKRERAILFVGHYGAGNYGNDASLAAAVAHVRSREPSAPIEVLCTTPEGLDPALGVKGRHLYAPRRPGRVGWFVGNLTNFITYVRRAAGARMVVVAGSGLMEGELHAYPFGAAYVLAVLSFTCFCVRRPFVLLGIGVSYLRHPFARAQGRLVGWCATQRSFRDAASLDVALQIGIARRGDLTGADIVFSLPPQSCPPPGNRSAAIGVMQLPETPDGAADDYIERTAEVVGALAADGWAVELVVGDDEDLSAVDAITERVGIAGHHAVRRNPARTIADISVAMANVDVVIATRFHNLVAGILAGRPTIAIAYASKATDVVARACSGPAFPVHGFAVEEVLDAIHLASERPDEVRSAIAARLPVLRADATRVLGSLDRFLNARPASA